MLRVIWKRIENQRYWMRATCLPLPITVNNTAQVCKSPLVSQLIEIVNNRLLPTHQNSEAC